MQMPKQNISKFQPLCNSVVINADIVNILTFNIMNHDSGFIIDFCINIKISLNSKLKVQASNCNSDRALVPMHGRNLLTIL